MFGLFDSNIGIKDHWLIYTVYGIYCPSMCEGPKLVLRGRKVSQLLIANMILFINKLKRQNIYIKTFSIAYWNTWYGSYAMQHAREDIIEHTSSRGHVFTF